MNIEQLRYFKQICDSQSLNKAAQALFISQPALTKSLHAMEKELNVKLLIRGKKGICPTEIGKVFLEDANTLLNTYDSLLHKINNSLTFSEALNIYMFPAIASAFAVTLLNNLKYHFPNLKINFNEIAFSDMRLLESMSKFLAITVDDPKTTAFLRQQPNLTLIPIKQEPVYLFASKNTLDMLYDSKETNFLQLKSIAFKNYKLYEDNHASERVATTDYIDNTIISLGLILNQEHVQFLPLSLGRIIYDHPDIMAFPLKNSTTMTYHIIVPPSMQSSEFSPVLEHIVKLLKAFLLKAPIK